MEDKIKVIVDTDPGVDDCIALMFFMFDERIDLKLVTTVSGKPMFLLLWVHQSHLKDHAKTHLLFTQKLAWVHTNLKTLKL